MTKEQREILAANLDGDGNEYHIRTIEYPSSLPGHMKDICLKIVTQMAESQQYFVDYYNEEGTTLHTERFFGQ